MRFQRQPFKLAHGIIWGVLFVGFTGLTFLATNRGLDDGPEHDWGVIRATAGTVTGPMTGALARGATHGCCFDASAGLLLYGLPALLIGVGVQFCGSAKSWWQTGLRLTFWTAGWFVWFGCGIVSLGHALS